jgi:hypothetical protein
MAEVDIAPLSIETDILQEYSPQSGYYSLGGRQTRQSLTTRRIIVAVEPDPIYLEIPRYFRHGIRIAPASFGEGPAIANRFAGENKMAAQVSRTQDHQRSRQINRHPRWNAKISEETAIQPLLQGWSAGSDRRPKIVFDTHSGPMTRCLVATTLPCRYRGQ